MLRDIFFLAIGFGAGWITFNRPQWATNAIEWLKSKFRK